MVAVSVPFEQLSPMQRKVIRHKTGALLVLAGPGTGKTEVLTHRISYLINQRNVPSNKISAVTFSRKAANEMVQRLSDSLELEKEQLHVSTLHAKSLRLLKNIGKNRKFLVANDGTRLLIEDTAEDLGFAKRARALRSLEKKIKLFKANNQLPSEVKNGFPQKFYQRYEELLDFNEAIDLDGLVLRVVRALPSGNPTSFFNNDEIGHLLVDEYQDINQAEYKLIRILAETAESLFVVGDDDQSIYGWRGADPDIIRGFEQDFSDGQIEILEESHRCPGHILKGAYAIVSKDPNCIKKPLCSSKDDGSPINILFSRSQGVEAIWITDWIKDYLSKEAARPSDIVMLAKTLNLADFLVEQLRLAKIKTTYWRSRDLFSDRNVLDILAHIRLIVDKEDNLALRRCVKTSTGRDIGRVAERKMRRIAEKNKCSLWDVMADGQYLMNLSRWKDPFKEFINRIDQMERAFSKLKLHQIVQLIAKKMATDRLSNIEKLTEFAKSLPDDTSLNSFLNELAQKRGLDLAGGGPKPETEEESVAVMSMHSAKGLGFKVVFILGMDNKIMPDLTRDENEQRRLCYVAMTRAKEELFLCHAKVRKGPAARGLSFYRYSKFLSDIPEKHAKLIDNEYSR